MLIINNNPEAINYLDRKPGENTIAYYPLTSESGLLDMSGNWHDLTLPNGAVTYDFTEFDRGIYNGGKPMRYGNLGTFDGSTWKFTVSFMFKSTANSWLFRFTNFWNGDRNNFDASTASGQIAASIYTGSSATRPNWGTWLDNGNRHHIVITKNGSTYSWYQDGELKSTWTNSTTIICYNSSQLWCHPNNSSVATTQWLSEFIVENDPRDLNTVKDYFGKIKRKFNLN